MLLTTLCLTCLNTTRKTSVAIHRNIALNALVIHIFVFVVVLVNTKMTSGRLHQNASFVRGNTQVFIWVILWCSWHEEMEEVIVFKEKGKHAEYIGDYTGLTLQSWDSCAPLSRPASTTSLWPSLCGWPSTRLTFTGCSAKWGTSTMEGWHSTLLQVSAEGPISFHIFPKAEMA